ncbi:BQ2448_4884 [Microbotryum intermedium]|uniref:BQ2448_4884 protein n=1 Tax=Microbotryum intermedium TaxID=269621 RepID=A0A238FED5_9BASI|nr:BQ2448_4884 [Microbotryum intermedium]
MWSTWPGYNPNHRWSKQAPSAPELTNESQLASTTGTASIDWVDSVSKFDLAAQNDGQVDVFVRMITRVPVHSVELLQRRLLLAWTPLRMLHPSLAYTVHDGPPEAPRHIPGVKNRAFRYHTPPSDRDAIEQAWRTSHEQVLNGPRTLLQQPSCLARLVTIVNDTKPSDAETYLDPVFLLTLSHVVSRRLPGATFYFGYFGRHFYSKWLDIFGLLTSPSLPTPPASPPCTRCSTELGLSMSFSWDVDPGFLAAWTITTPEVEQLSQLTLATEDLWPALPLESASALTFAFPRLSYPEVKTVLPRTEWLTLKMDVETSQRIVGVCWRERLSPSMLLYSIMSFIVSRFFASPNNSSPPSYCPLNISIRPFLDPVRGAGGPDLATDLAIRLTFGHIALPFYDTVAEESCSERLRFRTQNRGFFFADNYHRILYRVLLIENFRTGTTAAGQDPAPTEEPSTVINASMIGDLDRLLPSSFPLSTATVAETGSTESENVQANPLAPSLEITDFSIGTRLHRGEGMFTEVCTFGQQLYVSVGFDEQIYARFLNCNKVED